MIDTRENVVNLTADVTFHPSGQDDGPHASMKEYLVGFGLSVVLTAIPFGLVLTQGRMSSLIIASLVMFCAVVQVVVQMVCFLHMSTKTEGGWSVLALMFTIVLIVIALVGSIWIMHHLNDNMMPMSVDKMMSMP